MENHLADLPGNMITADCMLQSLIGRLIVGVIPATVKNNSFIINDVPADLKLSADPEIVTGILSNLFSTIAMHSSDSCIHISAKLDGNEILVQVTELQTLNTYTVAHCLEASQCMAEKIGGYVGITSKQKNQTTILFSFLNLPVAA